MTNLKYSKIVLNLEDDKKTQAFNFVNVFAFGKWQIDYKKPS